MTDIRNQELAKDPEIAASQREIDKLEGQLGELAVDTGLAAAGALPPPAGTVADVASLGRSVWKGDWGGALFDVAGLIPIVGDGAKAAKIADKANSIRKALNAAQALNAAKKAKKAFATTKKASKKYWDKVIAARRKSKRARLQKKLDQCKTQKCRDNIKGQMDEADKAKDTGRLPSSKKGKWVDPKTGKPCPPGTGNYVPDPDKNPSLYKALKKHGKENEGVPFKDGHPDFSGFSMKDANGKPIQVEIDMKGNSGDFTKARKAATDKYGSWSKSQETGHTWHHEPDGVTMTMVDKDVHTAFQTPTGAANSGTPHRGGDSMWRDSEF